MRTAKQQALKKQTHLADGGAAIARFQVPIIALLLALHNAVAALCQPAHHLQQATGQFVMVQL